MDSGGYNFVFDSKPYMVADETEYFAVYKDSKQIAAFKTKDAAVEYILWKKSNVRDM